MSDLPQKVLDLLTKHGGWQATLDYIARLESRPDPAPLGVRVPEERGSGTRGLEADYANGWNDCIAEVLRLNPQPGAVVSDDLLTAIKAGRDVLRFHARPDNSHALADAIDLWLTNTDKGVGK